MVSRGSEYLEIHSRRMLDRLVLVDWLQSVYQTTISAIERCIDCWGGARCQYVAEFCSDLSSPLYCPVRIEVMPNHQIFGSGPGTSRICTQSKIKSPRVATSPRHARRNTMTGSKIPPRKLALTWSPCRRSIAQKLFVEFFPRPTGTSALKWERQAADQNRPVSERVAIYTAMAVRKSRFDSVECFEASELAIPHKDDDGTNRLVRGGTGAVIKRSDVSFTMLSVHLKSACSAKTMCDPPEISASRDLGKQIPILNKWIDGTHQEPRTCGSR